MRYRKIAAALAAVIFASAALTSCSGADDQEQITTAETTTAITVEINTETLAPQDEQAVDDVTSLLKDVELENKTIKWFSFYDPFHATTSGNQKALSLELFEKKYGGEIEYIATTWQQRFSDLSTNILGGTGIDFTPGGDLDSFPRGVPNGQYESYDEYVDFSDELWAPVKDLNDRFSLGDRHYIICTQATGNEVVIYNRQTIESMGFDDPAELLERDEWTLSVFKQMLTDFVDPDAERYGLDGWFNERPLMLSCGVSPVDIENGQIVSRLYDERLEKVMEFEYSLNQNGLILDKGLFDWSEHPEFIGEGKELFYICGSYVLSGAPEIWTTSFGNAEDVMFVPIPRNEDADEYYLSAGLEAYMLCKGAGNPEGVARFMECILASEKDENLQQISDQQMRDNYGWSDEMIEMNHRVTEMAREHPMYSIHGGLTSDLSEILDNGEVGLRAAFYGHDWPSSREEIAATVDMLITEFNDSLNSIDA